MTDTATEEIPIHLNSRTFIRNMVPLVYPYGAMKGYDWSRAGGVFDNTDPRNVIYWGPPRPLNGDRNFGMRPGETPENAIRRLKIDGYIGIYSARPRADSERLDDGEDGAEEQAEELEPLPDVYHYQEPRERENENNSLESLHLLASSSNKRREEGMVSTPNGKRKSNRSEESADRREQRREDYLNGNGIDIPQMVGIGNGVENFRRNGEPMTGHDLPDDLNEDEDDTDAEEEGAPADPDAPVRAPEGAALAEASAVEKTPEELQADKEAKRLLRNERERQKRAEQKAAKQDTEKQGEPVTPNTETPTTQEPATAEEKTPAPSSDTPENTIRPKGIAGRGARRGAETDETAD